VKARQKYRSVIFFKDYFEKFFVRQSKKVKDKIIWTIELIEEIKKVPETYLKHIATTDGLFEIRVKSGRDIFRIFCFFDKGDLIVLMNGFQKKTQRTPRSEIRKALEIKKEYEHEQ
jgi:phage-related protein